MPTLHLAHQGSKLSLRTGRLLAIGPDGEVLGHAPARKIRRVVVHGNVGLTTPALTFLLKQGASVTYLSTTGRFYGMAAALPFPDPMRLIRQFEIGKTATGLVLAKSFVRAKLASQVEYLRRQGAATDRLESMKDLGRRLERARELNKVRGIEGMASRLYFETVASLHPNLGFEKRLRRPPRDAVNAALSYGYAMLLGLVTTSLMQAGLHPEIGILHATGRRRPALALDLMEEFRVAVVDVPVFSGFLRGQLDARQATLSSKGVLLGDALKKTLIESIEKRLSSPSPLAGKRYRDLIFEQGERLAASIVHGRPYRSFYLRRG